jgi:hypothetical protein
MNRALYPQYAYLTERTRAPPGCQLPVRTDYYDIPVMRNLTKELYPSLKLSDTHSTQSAGGRTIKSICFFSSIIVVIYLRIYVIIYVTNMAFMQKPKVYYTSLRDGRQEGGHWQQLMGEPLDINKSNQ